MSSIFDLEYAQNFMRMCDDGWNQGWHERNGGNLTYRLTQEEVALSKPFFEENDEWIALPVDISNLSGQYFMATGTGRYMRNVLTRPEQTLCVVEVSSDGKSYRIVYGKKNGVKPTSEIPTHLLNHSVKFAALGGKHRVIYHAHPANIIALTCVLPPTDKAVTNALWRSATECAVVYPQGVGVVEWMVPGGGEIAEATAKLMNKYNAVIWTYHGIFCSGADFDETFGLLHTIEKAAEIYVLALSTGIKPLRQMTDDDLIKLAHDFKVELNMDLLK